MTTTKHTPGPWVIHPQDPAIIVIEDMGLGFSAPYRLPHGRGRCLEQEANARLIAAAPELLAALDALLVTVDDGSPDADERTAARQAIAKAKGTP